MRSVAAQAALALGRPEQAEANFRAALAAAARAEQPRDVYVLVEYADFLLDQSRVEDVVELLRDAPRAESLMLREAWAREALAL